MLRSLEETKLLAKSLMPEKELKDPEEMFNNGMLAMRGAIMAELAHYVKSHSGDYREYQEMLNYMVENGILEDKMKCNYLSNIDLIDFWGVNE